MQTVRLSDTLEISRIVHGHWRLAAWNLSDRQLFDLIRQATELGVNTFDHADIYGDYRCEKLFGDALALDPGLRGRIRLVTKCGIKLLSENWPDRKLKHYDYSFDHIVASVEKSLVNFRTGHIDLLLLHRPAPFFNPAEVARAFDHLKKQGKVLNFGVSNFNPAQFAMLNSYTSEKLVTSQVEISPLCLEHFDNGNINFFLEKRISPMAWSPLAQGRILEPGDERGRRVLRALQEVADEMDAGRIDSVIWSWLLSHPAGIIPVVGSGRIGRLKVAADALTLKMSTEQWYRIYTASTGTDVP